MLNVGLIEDFENAFDSVEHMYEYELLNDPSYNSGIFGWWFRPISTTGQTPRVNFNEVPNNIAFTIGKPICFVRELMFMPLLSGDAGGTRTDCYTYITFGNSGMRCSLLLWYSNNVFTMYPSAYYIYITTPSGTDLVSSSNVGSLSIFPSATFVRVTAKFYIVKVSATVYKCRIEFTFNGVTYVTPENAFLTTVFDPDWQPSINVRWHFYNTVSQSYDNPTIIIGGFT